MSAELSCEGQRCSEVKKFQVGALPRIAPESMGNPG